ncbi:hypothetical protein GS461_21270 [Rhodococcus hoagii]|nr:hypothetical protein [Prescottella equi]
MHFPTLATGERLVVDSYPDNDTYTSNLNPLFVGRMSGIEFEFAVPPAADRDPGRSQQTRHHGHGPAAPELAHHRRR